MPNITLPGDFPSHLRRLRTERGLSEADLGEKAGLTYKTIRDLETGRRRRVLERTVMSLATALDLGVAELLGQVDTAGEADAAIPPAAPAADRRGRSRLGLALLGAVLVISLWSAAGFARRNATWEIGGNQLTVRDGIAGLTLWSTHSENVIVFCQAAPWDARQLLIGLGSETIDGGRLLCVDRASGDTLWSTPPDLTALNDAFGAETVMAANFSCAEARPVDFDGDGEAEVAVRFTHGCYYPTAICVVDRTGRLRSQYANRGHLTEMLVADLDQDGTDEILACGTNNAAAYQGATVVALDLDACSGASVDSLSPPAVAAVDGAAARLVMPAFAEPYMELSGAPRLVARRLQTFRGAEGQMLVSVDVLANEDVRTIVTLDANLHPLGVVPVDRTVAYAREAWPDSLASHTGPGDRAWLAAWMEDHRYFRSGQRTPVFPQPQDTPSIATTRP